MSTNNVSYGSCYQRDRVFMQNAQSPLNTTNLMVSLDTEEESNYICPITLRVMEDPVVLRGRHYEKEALLKWVNKDGRDPETREKVNWETDVRPDARMKDIITLWQKRKEEEKVSNLLSEAHEAEDNLDYSKAIEKFQIAWEQNHKKFQARDLCSWGFLELKYGMNYTARERFEKALCLNPNSVKAIEGLIQLDEKENNFQMALDRIKIVSEKNHRLRNFFADKVSMLNEKILLRNQQYNYREPISFEEVEVPSDGNSLFNATIKGIVETGIYKDPALYDQSNLRNLVATALKEDQYQSEIYNFLTLGLKDKESGVFSNKICVEFTRLNKLAEAIVPVHEPDSIIYNNFINNFINHRLWELVPQYIKDINQGETCGGEVELKILSQILGIQIEVIFDDGNKTCYGEKMAPIVFLRFTGDNYKARIPKYGSSITKNSNEQHDKAMEFFKEGQHLEYRKGRSYEEKMQDYEDAVKKYEQALNLGLGGCESSSFMAKFHYDWSYCLLKLRRLDEAKEHHEKTLEFDKTYEHALKKSAEIAEKFFNRGKIEIKQSQFEECIKSFQSCYELGLSPHLHAELHKEWGYALVRSKKNRDGLDHYLKGLSAPFCSSSQRAEIERNVKFLFQRSENIFIPPDYDILARHNIVLRKSHTSQQMFSPNLRNHSGVQVDIEEIFNDLLKEPENDLPIYDQILDAQTAFVHKNNTGCCANIRKIISMVIEHLFKMQNPQIRIEDFSQMHRTNKCLEMLQLQDVQYKIQVTNAYRSLHSWLHSNEGNPNRHEISEMQIYNVLSNALKAIKILIQEYRSIKH